MSAKDQQANDSPKWKYHPRNLWIAAVSAASAYCTAYCAEHKKREENETALVFWTMFTGLGTGAAVVVAGGAAYLLLTQIEDGREATILANRAWITPSNAHLLIGSAGPSRMVLGAQIDISDIGNGPAFKVEGYIEPFWIFLKPDFSTGFPVIDMNKQKIRPNLACDKIPAKAEHGTVWQKQPGVTILTNQGAEPPPEFYRHNATVAFHGCFKYTSFGKPHFTRVCELLSPMNLVPFTQWKWGYCPGAGQNDAD